MKIVSPGEGSGIRPDPSAGCFYQGRYVEYPAPYFQLECGHYTDQETQEFFRLWRPKKKDFYCDHWPKGCGWVKIKPKKQAQSLPDEPMF